MLDFALLLVQLTHPKFLPYKGACLPLAAQLPWETIAQFPQPWQAGRPILAARKQQNEEKSRSKR
ncbi:MAG TPA: hypothetical protein VKE71_09775 [Candidatus Angelobacter sp.]|nr:hypothetical protein [Candidatus Angelobacter sp.]